MLRRHQTKREPKTEKIIKADGLEIDQERHLVTWQNKPVNLTVTERMLLVSLAKRPGMVQNRSQLMDAAYDGTIYVSDRTIDSHIRNIRNKLKAVDNTCDIILTIHGLGYKMRT